MRSNDNNVRLAYETKFQTEQKTKLNQLSQINGMTQRFNVLLISLEIHQQRILYCATEGISMFDAIKNDQCFKLSFPFYPSSQFETSF